jgi:hypothetical protein
LLSSNLTPSSSLSQTPNYVLKSGRQFCASKCVSILTREGEEVIFEARAPPSTHTRCL